jgi:putative transposase
MSRSKHTEAQVIGALKQLEAGRKAEDVAREVGVSKYTIYTWKAKYGGMDVSQAQEAKHLRDENARLRKLVADLSLDKEALQSGHLSRKLCLRDSRSGLESGLKQGIELVKHGSDISGQAFPFALLQGRNGKAEFEL